MNSSSYFFSLWEDFLATKRKILIQWSVMIHEPIKMKLNCSRASHCFHWNPQNTQNKTCIKLCKLCVSQNRKRTFQSKQNSQSSPVKYARWTVQLSTAATQDFVKLAELLPKIPTIWWQWQRKYTQSKLFTDKTKVRSHVMQIVECYSCRKWVNFEETKVRL